MTGAIQAVVAIKPPALGKRRLTAGLADEDRRALILAMLDDVLAATAQATQRGALAGTLLVGGDRSTDDVAAGHDAVVLRDAGAGFTAAVADGIAAVRATRAGAVLVLPADLPLIDADAIEALIDRRPAGPSLVITPDRQRLGSNAVLLAPPDAMPLVFDGASFEPHCTAARAHGLATVVADIERLALDVDTIDDLSRLAAHPRAGPSRGAAIARAILAARHPATRG